MKRKTKIQIILSILLIIPFVTLGGYFYMKHQEKELMQEQKPRIEKFLYYNFNNIKSVTLTNTYTNPTGVIHIEGYINGDKSLTIDAPIDKNGVEIVNGTGSNRLYDDYLKDEFRYKSKNVTEIEAEEKAKKKEKAAESNALNLNSTRSIVDILDDAKTVEQDIFKTYPKHT